MQPILLSPPIHNALDLPTWNALAHAEHVQVADHLAERLEAAGWSLAEPPSIRAFGPPDEPQPILQVTDARTALPFSLIPGGTFRPGIPPRLLTQFRQVYLAFESWKAEAYDGAVEPEDQWQPEEPHSVWPFASRAPCDLTQKPRQRVEPFLLAAELVTPHLPGLRKIAPPEGNYWKERWTRARKRAEAWHGRWEKVGPILRRFGWDLPTTWEFEWALRGGVDGLFYWGGPAPSFQGSEAETVLPATLSLDKLFDAVMAYSFARDRPRDWPYCNRFGLAAMLGAGTWCRPSDEEGDSQPLITRGGAAGCWGWQACKEWLLLLTACESRQSISNDYADNNAIRPVVRLTPDAAVPLG